MEIILSDPQNNEKTYTSVDFEVMIDNGYPHLQEINMGRGDRANGFPTLESTKAFIERQRTYNKTPVQYVVVETRTVHTVIKHRIEE
jgi:hypothetical protein